MIRYSKGYKYQLDEEYSLKVNIMPKEAIIADYISIATQGRMTIAKGYAWDGASGPAIDTKTIMRGSLVHDALYQLIRRGYLDASYREVADKEMQRIFREDRMMGIRAWWCYRAVRWFGGPSADPKSRRETHTAP